MATTFLENLQKQIAEAIEEDASSRAKKGPQPNQSLSSSHSNGSSYANDQLAELIFYSAQIAATVLQQDLARQTARLTLSPNQPAVDPNDALAHLSAIIRLNHWAHPQNPTLRQIFTTASDLTHEILLRDLYNEESRSFQLQERLIQDKLTSSRKRGLAQNLNLFVKQLNFNPQTKEQLLAHISSQTFLNALNNPASTELITHLTRNTLKEHFANHLAPLNQEQLSAIAETRHQSALALKQGMKITLPSVIIELGKQTLAAAQKAFNPLSFPAPKDITQATIQKLSQWMPSLPPALGPALQTALETNLTGMPGQDKKQTWTTAHYQIIHLYESLNASQKHSTEAVLGRLNVPLNCALALSSTQHPLHTNTLHKLATVLATGQLSASSALETLAAIFAMQQQLETDKKNLQIRVGPDVKAAAQAAFDPLTEKEPNTLTAALRQFKQQGDQLIIKLKEITSTVPIVHSQSDTPLKTRIERALALTQVHPSLLQGITQQELTNQVITLLKPREAQQDSLHRLYVTHLISKANGEEPAPLLESALKLHTKPQPSAQQVGEFHALLSNTIQQILPPHSTANADETKKILSEVAELLSYRQLQPLPDPKQTQHLENQIINEIIRFARAQNDSKLEAQFKNPSEDDRRTVAYQARKQLETLQAEHISHTLRKNSEYLDDQRLNLQYAFSSPDQLAKTWTQKEQAEASIKQSHQTKASEIQSRIALLENALKITEEAKNFQSVQQFKDWITTAHQNRLDSALIEQARDPFNPHLHRKVQELTEFKDGLHNGRTSIKDTGTSGLDIRTIWDILNTYKAEINRELHQLNTQLSELHHAKKTFETTAGTNPPPQQRQKDRAHNSINSLSHAFDQAFKNDQSTTNTLSPRPFQGQSLEIILETAKAHSDLEQRTEKLNLYWNNFIPTPAANTRTKLADPIKACSKLLIYHELAQHETQVELPAALQDLAQKSLAGLQKLTPLRQRKQSPKPSLSSSL